MRSATVMILFLLFWVPAVHAQSSLGYGFVGCSYADSAHRFDLDDELFDLNYDLLPEGNYPYDATIKPDGSEVWIPAAAGEYPISVAFSPDGSLAMVSCRDGGGVWRIDAETYAPLGVTPLDSDYLGPGNIALNPATGSFFVVEWYDDSFWELSDDGSEVTRTQMLGSSLWQLVVSHDGSRLYVTDRGEDKVWALDAETLATVDSYAVGDDPWAVDITADDAKLVVGCEDSRDAWFIDMENDLVHSLALAADADPRDVDILDAAGLAYLCGGQVSGGSPVYVLDLASEALLRTLFVQGANTNVVAVQPQMPGDVSGAPVTPAAAPRLSAWPNPFNPTTEISITLDRAGQAELRVLDCSGRLLRTLASGRLEAGEHRFEWDGRDAAGRRQPSGLYLAVLDGERGGASRKLVMLK